MLGKDGWHRPPRVDWNKGRGQVFGLLWHATDKPIKFPVAGMWGYVIIPPHQGKRDFCDNDPIPPPEAA